MAEWETCMLSQIRAPDGERIGPTRLAIIGPGAGEEPRMFSTPREGAEVLVREGWEFMGDCRVCNILDWPILNLETYHFRRSREASFEDPWGE